MEGGLMEGEGGLLGEGVFGVGSLRWKGVFNLGRGSSVYKCVCVYIYV